MSDVISLIITVFMLIQQ